MNEYTILIALGNTATLVTGGAIALLAYRAFRRTGSPALRALALGFTCIVAGSVVGGAIHLLADNVALGVAVQSSITAGGFAVLLYSLFVDRSRTTIVRARGSQ
ncbi:DUF7521 family protein [Halosolutus gelatinilyticus]|uniref:DUF7521 family protein n=1 Tax=Halosolutus gelatinilyticus TaxID=2931975 RepID=UPI001FF18D83|nr:hypothetical protein [Halosolutus gelatinilyticus]